VVPAGIEKPYQTQASRAFAERGWLAPVEAKADDTSVQEASRLLQAFLENDGSLANDIHFRIAQRMPPRDEGAQHPHGWSLDGYLSVHSTKVGPDVIFRLERFSEMSLSGGGLQVAGLRNRLDANARGNRDSLFDCPCSPFAIWRSLYLNGRSAGRGHV
jgi:hypothetical protein